MVEWGVCGKGKWGGGVNMCRGGMLLIEEIGTVGGEKLGKIT